MQRPGSSPVSLTLAPRVASGVPVGFIHAVLEKLLGHPPLCPAPGNSDPGGLGFAVHSVACGAAELAITWEPVTVILSLHPDQLRQNLHLTGSKRGIKIWAASFLADSKV